VYEQHFVFPEAACNTNLSATNWGRFQWSTPRVQVHYYSSSYFTVRLVVGDEADIRVHFALRFRLLAILIFIGKFYYIAALFVEFTTL